LSNLTPGTKYKATARSKTTDGRYSEYTSPLEFTTKALTKGNYFETCDI